MSVPLISVITPTYNRPYVLGELLESLSRQTYRNLEIIIINDHGIDVKFVKDAYPELQVHIIDLDTNLKHVHARNYGLAQATGDYILLCDDDDLLLSTHIERMVAELEDADLVYSDVEIFNYHLEQGVRMPTSRFLFAYEYDPQEMRKFSTFVSSGCLYRKSIHDKLGPFDTEVYNYWDWDFILRVAEHYRVKRVAVASSLYCFSEQGDNLSNELGGSRAGYLELLSIKHQLGELPSKNFFVLLDEPAMISRKASSEVVWDGLPFVSRLVDHHGQ